MNKQKIKICGISNLLILKELIALEVDYVGFIFFTKSPRNVSNDFLESLKEIDFKSTRPVCVFVNPKEEEVYQTSSYLTDPILQFHGDESDEFCESFGLDYWKAIRVKNETDLDLIDLYPSASAILLENHVPGTYGGTGESFDWNILDNSAELANNIVLSGGINSENVHNAITTNSWCIDLNSGVESEKGVKDIKLIKNILNIIKNYEIK
jgi:phosphoribosylanthranilate isomerase